ncbi:MAG: hypothetical protein H0X36_11845 [Sphingomonadaceae bacterium]|nr:hypothetical protein [Sphingomonadaceae bacterium]
MRALLFMAICLIVAGCGKPPAAKAPPRDEDPAVAAALAQPLMTDPEMAAAADGEAAPVLGHAIPAGATAPVREGSPTLGQVAAAAVGTSRFAGCDPRIAYSAQWMNRVAPSLALPNAARLSEAAGSDTPACALRVVRYAIAATPAQSLDHYAALARRGGFAATRTTNRIEAAKDGEAFVATVASVQGGASVDLVSRRNDPR